MLKKSLLIAAFAGLAVTGYADRTFERRFVDRHCNSHIQLIRVDDEGNEQVINDVIIGTTTPCDGE
jgi:hypothetical protein